MPLMSLKFAVILVVPVIRYIGLYLPGETKAVPAGVLSLSGVLCKAAIAISTEGKSIVADEATIGRLDTRVNSSGLAVFGVNAIERLVLCTLLTLVR